MTAFRVIVTGSRTWADSKTVFNVLLNLTAPDRYLTVVHGACPDSPDMTAARFVAATRRTTEEPWPADWDTYGNGAGMVRNTAMVAAGADLCLAFIATCNVPSCPRKGRHGTHGASDCALKAMDAGIELRVFGPWALLFAQLTLDVQ